MDELDELDCIYDKCTDCPFWTGVMCVIDIVDSDTDLQDIKADEK